MQLVPLGPITIAALPWQPREGEHAVTLIAKTTLRLEPGRMSIAESLRPLERGDRHWDDDPQASVRVPSDFAPVKRKADVVVVGEAFSQQPARSVTTRLCVGDVDKRLEVVCDRFFDEEGHLREMEPFTRMPLRWERAPGGPHTPNPVGRGPGRERDRYGRLRLPNLQPLGHVIDDASDALPVVGLGPIHSSWPPRRAMLGIGAMSWREDRLRSEPLPPDVDAGYFNVAPADQRLERIGATERIVLEHLHPDEPRLVAHLPGLETQAFALRGGDVETLELRADTLWIDTSEQICCLVWRQHLPVRHPDELDRAVIALKGAGRELGWEEVAAQAQGEGRGEVARPAARAKSAFDADEVTAAHGVQLPGVPLPFGKAGRAAPPPPAAEELPRAQSAGSTSAIPDLGALHTTNPPWVRPEASPDEASPRKPGAPVGERSASGPRDPSAARTAQPSAAGDAVKPWSQTGQSPPAADEEPVAGSPWARPTGSQAGGGVPAVRPPTPAVSTPSPAPTATPASPTPEPAGRPARGVELLWFDEASVDAIAEAHEELLRDLSLADRDAPIGFDEELPPPMSEAERHRKMITAVLTRSRAATAEGLDTEMAEAVGEDGAFDPPLVVLAGRLALPFAELERLKATLAAVTPLIAGDKRLQETVDTVREAMDTPWIDSSEEVARGLTDKVRRAFEGGERLVDARQLEEHTERILLERRCFQKRTLLGKELLRSLLTPSGERTVIPAYLPEVLRDRLPMLATLDVRLLVRAHLRQDPYDPHPVALEVLAFGRALPTSVR